MTSDLCRILPLAGRAANFFVECPNEFGGRKSWGKLEQADQHSIGRNISIMSLQNHLAHPAHRPPNHVSSSCDTEDALQRVRVRVEETGDLSLPHLDPFHLHLDR